MNSMMKTALFFALAGGLMGCRGEAEVRAWVERAEQLKGEVVRNIPIVPYRQEQNQAFKAYFAEITQLAYAAGENPKVARAIDRSLLKADLAAICGRVLVPSQEWRTLEENCIRNGFFLCSEDVRAYPTALRKLVSLLSADLQAQFGSTPECQGAIEGQETL